MGLSAFFYLLFLPFYYFTIFLIFMIFFLNRISYIKPPYDKSSFQVINLKTKELAKNRENMRKSWDSALEKNAKTINAPPTKPISVFETT